MAIIDDLRKSVSEMNDDELRNRLRDIRKQRHINKQVRKTAKKKPVSIESLLSEISPEQAAEILKQLG